jgi:transcription factor SPN1
MTDEEVEAMANKLALQMRDAVNEDNKANQNGRPALSKLMLVDQVTKDLRKLSVQEKFLDIGGISMLGRWLEPLPDRTYPNINVAKEILNTLNSL